MDPKTGEALPIVGGLAATNQPIGGGFGDEIGMPQFDVVEP
jgi:hypothetical protein